MLGAVLSASKGRRCAALGTGSGSAVVYSTAGTSAAELHACGYRRIGAARRRSDITDFFQGSLVSPYVLPGADDRPGTADDMFAPTNETAAQIRDRVLPLGATING